VVSDLPEYLSAFTVFRPIAVGHPLLPSPGPPWMAKKPLPKPPLSVLQLICRWPDPRLHRQRSQCCSPEDACGFPGLLVDQGLQLIRLVNSTSDVVALRSYSKPKMATD